MSGTAVDMALTGSSCEVPHEVLASAGGHLKIGVYGTKNEGQKVTPTIWADAGPILEGAEPSEVDPTPATESLVQQILEAAEAAETIAQSVRDDADNGAFDGADGQDGVSPTISSSSITGGHRLTITDANGTSTVDVMNGADGQDGQQGPAGPGVPAGGTTGQVLKKKSGTDYDTEWGDGGSGDIFLCTYNSTTSAEIETAFQAGKSVLVVKDGRTYGLSYRQNATKHYFTTVDRGSLLYLNCSSNSWSGNTTHSTIKAPASPSEGDVLTYSSGAWTAAAPSGGGADPYTSNPAALGTASPGSSDDYARGDHVHDFDSDFKAALLQIAAKVAYIDGGGADYYFDLESALLHRVLSSISAVYTQSGAVYDSDSLDSLKADLVVTAYYSDSSTTTVADADYTLSGTLEPGTSTITVTYKSKTTTFTVTVTHDVLPAQYKMKNYISNPNQTTSGPLVNTGVTPSSTGSLAVDIDFMMTSTTPWSSSDAYKYVIAINKGTGYSTVGVCVGIAPDNYTVLAFNGASSSITPNGTSSVLDKRMSISATFATTGSSITDGTLSASQTGTGREHGKPIYLFGLKTNAGADVPMKYFMIARIYGCTVWDNGTKILDLIPCIRKSDSVAGFWDLVTEAFITATGLEAG